MGIQGFGRVAPSSGGQQGYQSSGGIPPSFDSGSGGQSFGQPGGQSVGQSGGQSFGGQSGGQSYGGQSTDQGFGGQSGGQGAGSKYNAGQALADQGVADQAAFVGSKTVGHHNIPHYDKEDPKLPAAVGAMSGSGMAQQGGASGGSGRGDNLPSQQQVTVATEGQPTGQVQSLASCSYVSLFPHHGFCVVTFKFPALLLWCLSQ